MARRQINDDELNNLYALIGKGIWHLQYLEDALHTYITIKRDIKIRGSIKLEKAAELLAKNRMNVLNKSIKEAKEAQVISLSLQERLENFKEERNWLVHRSVHQNGDDLYVDELRYALMERLEAFSCEAIVLQKLIDKELEDFCVSWDISKEWIDQQSEQEIKTLKGI
jgi:hypothetical protein